MATQTPIMDSTEVKSERKERGYTRNLIRTLKLNQPDMPAVEIAKLLSISKERVRQCLVAEGLPTRVRPDYGECEVCGTALKAGRKAYCSTACRSIDCRVSFRCDYCGQAKAVLQSVYNAQKRRGYKYMYCSHQCRSFGKWEAIKLQPRMIVSVS